MGGWMRWIRRFVVFGRKEERWFGLGWEEEEVGGWVDSNTNEESVK